MYKSKLLRDSKNVVRYVDRNGVLVKNRWITVSGKKYYFDQYGHALKGRKKVGQNYYYFQTKYGYMMKHVRYMDSKDDLYYFGGDGIMVKSVFYTWSGNNERHTYYFTASGRACRSWLTHDGKKYYFDTSGVMLAYTIASIDGTTYRFDSDGAATKTSGNDYTVEGKYVKVFDAKNNKYYYMEEEFLEHPGIAE